MSDLRYYSFINFYLSSIQQGIQSFHNLHEMFVKYAESKDANDRANFDRIMDWAKNHKTMITLNGGMHQDIVDGFNLMQDIQAQLSFPAPFASFFEGHDALGGIMTGFGVVVPQEIYDAVDYRKALILTSPLQQENWLLDREAYYFIHESSQIIKYEPETADWKFIKMLKSCPLAR